LASHIRRFSSARSGNSQFWRSRVMV